MRVLLALDGSEPSDRARQLVHNLQWPPGTSIRLISVVADRLTMFGGPWTELMPATAPEIETAVLEQQRQVLDTAAAGLAGPGRTVETVLARGRAATAILQDAAEFRADILVLGARGHGAWETALLGSVSAEVVDHAACPVLVARVASLERVVFADDGSESAERAVDLLAGWEPFRDVPVRVVSVASVPAPWQSGVSPLMMDAAFEAHADSLREAQARLRDVAERAASRLTARGSTAEVDVRVGDPARQIVAAATDFDASLIVMGSRGLSGIRRILLGSVARNVLHQAPCSVLVVRGSDEGRRPEHAAS